MNYIYKCFLTIFVGMATICASDSSAGVTKKFKIETRDGYTVILDARGNPVGDRFPQFRNYDLYLQGDGTPTLEDLGVGPYGNVAHIKSIHNLFGLEVVMDYVDKNTPTKTTLKRDAAGNWPEWVNFDKNVPQSGSIELTIFIPTIRLADNVLRSFAIRSQAGRVVLFDLATGERTYQTYPQHKRYSMVIGENGAIALAERRFELMDAAIIEEISNPYGYEYSVQVVESGKPPLSFKTMKVSWDLRRAVPKDKRGGEGINVVVYNSPHTVVATCNGSVEACALPYNLVSSIMTHNSAAYKPEKYGLGFANDALSVFAGKSVLSIHDQLRSPMQQMQDGVRTLQVRAMDWKHDDVTDVYACHGLMISDVPEKYRELVKGALKGVYERKNFQGCDVDPGRMPLHNLLVDIKAFLSRNPREVVTLVIQNDGDRKLLAKAFDDAQVSSLMYKHVGPQDSWPTLQQLIDTGKRLVVFVRGGEYGLFNDYDSYMVGTKYDFPDIDSLRNFDLATANLTKNVQSLFILPNQVTTGLAGDENMAKQANQEALLLKRAEQVKTGIGKYPNFISLDFYHQPSFDGIRVVNALNKKTFKEYMASKPGQAA